jgi:hypothetical protein
VSGRNSILPYRFSRSCSSLRAAAVSPPDDALVLGAEAPPQAARSGAGAFADAGRLYEAEPDSDDERQNDDDRGDDYAGCHGSASKGCRLITSGYP